MSRFASALPAQTPPSYTTAMRANTISVVLALVAATATVSAQDQGGTTVVRGGVLFDGVQDKRVPNTGIVVRGGVFQEVGADLEDRDLTNARVVQLTKDDTVLPGLFDLHAHFGIDLFGRGRIDEIEHYPRIFLGNGVTSVFPAGEMTPDKMADLRRRIDAGKSVGPRIFNSGPYFGSARPGWNRNASSEQIRQEVDEWAEKGARGFKAKGIRAGQLRALIERPQATKYWEFVS